jgi:hypothetical protein
VLLDGLQGVKPLLSFQWIQITSYFHDLSSSLWFMMMPCMGITSPCSAQ